MTEAAATLLDVRHLSTQFVDNSRVVRAVDDVSFVIKTGETLGLIGESGSGKTATARSILRLIPSPPGRITSGEVLFGGVDLLTLSDKDLRAVRGSQIGFVFQDPSTSLNPLHTIGNQVGEMLQTHVGLSRRASEERVVELLARVGIPHPKERLGAYPFEFSGGMRQRVMIAIAIACEPRLLIADEPTTALDVTVQAQILELIAALSDEIGTAVLLITHNLGIAAGMCDRVNVMYAGQIVETSRTQEIFARPQMPYTQGLLDAVPMLRLPRIKRLRAIVGSPPDLSRQVPGCRFAERCPYRQAICDEIEPDLTARDAPSSHLARCHGTATGGWLT